MGIPNALTATSVSAFADLVLHHSRSWHLKSPAWFRGQQELEGAEELRLLPKVFHPEYLGRENELVQVFRMRAQMYGATPEFSRIDQWLFLMQHTGLPTRLLDWSEGALIALYFAINRYDPSSDTTPVVWMINPLALNLFAMGLPGFSLTWLGYRHESPVPIPHIVAAFQDDATSQPPYPVAVYPHHVHPRLTAQRGTFTIHGGDKRSIDAIFASMNESTLRQVARASINALTPKGRATFGALDSDRIASEFLDGSYITRIEIECSDREEYLRDLRSLGVSQSTLFPEMDGLAAELKHLRTEIF